MSAAAETQAGAAVLVHGTAIALGMRGILIRGSSGLGKSDLALRAVCSAPSPASPEAVRLISDDQVLIRRASDGLRMTAPDSIRGLLEVRGVGLAELPRQAVTDVPVPLVLVVNLVADRAQIERLPDPQAEDILGLRVAALKVFPFETSAIDKLRLAAQMVRI